MLRHLWDLQRWTVALVAALLLALSMVVAGGVLVGSHHVAAGNVPPVPALNTGATSATPCPDSPTCGNGTIMWVKPGDKGPQP